MAPIPRLAYKPISILTGAILGAISGPSTSSPPVDGNNATMWGTEYQGMASLVDIRSIAGNSTVDFDLATNTSTPTPIVSQVYYIAEQDNYMACNGSVFFKPEDDVVFLNALQFGNLTDPAQNSTCGQWIDISSRTNAAQTVKAQIVGVCDECEYGSIAAPIHLLDDLAPELDLYSLTFDNASTTNIANITESSLTISPRDLLPVTWQLAKAPGNETSVPTPTPTTSAPVTKPTKPTPTDKDDEDDEEPAKPSPTKSDPPSKPSGKTYSGRGTWFSDTSGQCEHKFSQSDMIVAVNEAQMGNGKSLCGRKLAVKRKGYDETVVVTVVDMCPSKYCDYGDLDISQGAFKRLAALSVGVLQLEWSFVDGDN